MRRLLVLVAALALAPAANAAAAMTLQLSTTTPGANETMSARVTTSDAKHFSSLYVVLDGACPATFGEAQQREDDAGGPIAEVQEPNRYAYAEVKSGRSSGPNSFTYTYRAGYWDRPYRFCAYEFEDGVGDSHNPLGAEAAFTPRLDVVNPPERWFPFKFHHDSRGRLRISLAGGVARHNRYWGRRWSAGYAAVGRGVRWVMPGVAVAADGTFSYSGRVWLDETTNYDTPIPAFFPGKPKYGHLVASGRLLNEPGGAASWNWTMTAGGYRESGHQKIVLLPSAH